MLIGSSPITEHLWKVAEYWFVGLVLKTSWPSGHKGSIPLTFRGDRTPMQR